MVVNIPGSFVSGLPRVANEADWIDNRVRTMSRGYVATELWDFRNSRNRRERVRRTDGGDTGHGTSSEPAESSKVVGAFGK